MKKVVIVGFGYTSRLCLIRSFAQLGCEITVVVIEGTRWKPVDCYSRYVKKVFYYKSGSGGEGLVRLLIDNCSDRKEKSILIPNNDFSTLILDKNYNSLEKYFILPSVKGMQGGIVEWMNKEKQKSLASKFGLNVAKSVNVDIKDQSYSLPYGIQYPCFTKTRAYTTGYKSTLHRCDNEKELRTVLDKLCKMHNNMTIMVEEFKKIENEYAVVGFSDGNKVCIPGVLKIISMAQGNDKGVACQGAIMPIKGYENLIEKFSSFMLEIGFVGLFDIDFYLSEGSFYFGELNLRIGGSGYAVMKMGVNLPAMYVKSILGFPVDAMHSEITNVKTYVNERICLENWSDGYLSTKMFLHILNSSDISFVKDNNDRKPELAFKREMFFHLIKKFLLRWGIKKKELL